jgi:hypothetical protein
MTSTDGTQREARCLRPGCGRKLTSAESIARGYGSGCWRKVRQAAAAADLSAWTPGQAEEARQAIGDGAVVPSTRAGVCHVVSVDGSEVHLTHRDACNCTSGLKNRPPRPCWHRCAVAMVLASAPVPEAPRPAATVTAITPPAAIAA